MAQRATTEEERMTDTQADTPTGMRTDVQNSGEYDGTRDEAASDMNDGAASGTGGELARLTEEMSGLRERLSEAEEENRRLAEDCRQARAERDEAVRRQEALGREAALRRYLTEKGLSGDAAEIALRGLRADTGVIRDGRTVRDEAGSGDGVPVRDDVIIRLDSGGNLAEESRAALDGLMEGPYRPLFRIGENGGGVRGIALDNPPPGSGIGSLSREEILSIRDGEERRRAIADNPDVFGL